MRTLNVVFLTLTLLLCGAYAGMTLFCQIGLLPTMRRLDLRTYVSTWGIIDGLMERAMPPYKLTLLLVTLASAICLFVQHHSALALAASISFLLSLAGLVLTIAVQVPLNRRVCSFPADGDGSVLVALRTQTERNFGLRMMLAILAFAALCVGAVNYPLH